MLDDAKSVTVQNQSLQVVFPSGSLWLDSFKEREAEVKSLIEKQTGKVFNIEVHAGGISHADQSKIEEQKAKESMKEDPIIKEAMGILNAKIERIKTL